MRNSGRDLEGSIKTLILSISFRKYDRCKFIKKEMQEGFNKESSWENVLLQQKILKKM